MLEEASRNTERAVLDAQKLLRAEQWILLPQVIRDRPVPEISAAPPTG
jgi:hypothetical protein